MLSIFRVVSMQTYAKCINMGDEVALMSVDSTKRNVVNLN